jgi:hypothetical protein
VIDRAVKGVGLHRMLDLLTVSNVFTLARIAKKIKFYHNYYSTTVQMSITTQNNIRGIVYTTKKPNKVIQFQFQIQIYF